LDPAAPQVHMKLEDEAGGIRRSSLANVWSYRSLSQSAWWTASDGLSLPLVRLHCKYFGGSLALVPIEGHGTDCYVTFNRLPEENAEQIQPRSSREPLSGSSSMNIFDAQSRRAY